MRSLDVTEFNTSGSTPGFTTTFFTGVATAALVAANASSPQLAGATENYRAQTPLVITAHSPSTFSFFERSVERIAMQEPFEKEVSNFFAALSEGQEPLGSEFENLWNQHSADLYES